MKCVRLLAFVFWGLSVFAQAQPSSYVVVVGQHSRLKHLNAHELSNIFLGRIEALPGIGVVRPIEAAEDSPLRLAFHAEITGMSEHKLRSHWAAMVFTGKARPPLKCESVTALRSRLNEDPQTIGYVRREDLDNSLKQVFP